MIRSKHFMSAALQAHTSLPALRHARRPSGMAIVRGHAAQELQVGGRTAVLHGQRQAVLYAARPAFQGHAFGLLAQVRIGGAGGATKAAEMGGCGVHANDGDEQAGVVFFDGDIQDLHRATIQGPRSIARD